MFARSRSHFRRTRGKFMSRNEPSAFFLAIPDSWSCLAALCFFSGLRVFQSNGEYK